MYFIADFKKLYKNKIIRILFFILLILFVVEPILTKIQTVKYPWIYTESLGINPFHFWSLMGNAGIASQVYYMLNFIFPVLIAGIIYYEEYKTSVGKLLIVKRNCSLYLFSKVTSVFVFTFLFFLILLGANLIITYIIIPSEHSISLQYIPSEGTFASDLFLKNPIYMAFFYTICNALTQAIYASFIVLIQMIVKFPNQYIAMITPVVLIYAITYFADSIVEIRQYDINIIIQPASSYAITTIVKLKDYILTFAGWICLEIILFIIGRIRNRDIL